MITERSSHRTVAEWLDHNAPNPPLRNEFTPVSIFQDRNARGIGTLWKREHETLIVSASHVFSSEYGYSFWTYRLPHDDRPRMYPIQSAQALRPENGCDIAICSLPDIIYSPYFTGFVDYDMKTVLLKQMKEAETARDEVGEVFSSLATGETYKRISIHNLKNGDTAHVIEKSGTSSGESGTGFIDSCGKLYVLTGGINETPDPKYGSAYSILFAVPDFKPRKL